MPAPPATSKKNAFADPAQFSQGFHDQVTTRNSMAIFNNGFSKRFFWDGRADNLPEQVMMPIQNHIEMGMESEEVLAGKLKKASYYPGLFEAAFGDSEITPKRISVALTQFISSIVSFKSKFDQGAANGYSNFTLLEKDGREIFKTKAKCNNCHTSPLFTSTWGRFSNIGLDINYEDEGIGGGLFKVPSLRNIALTAPYMHDGRFKTLEEVIEHYDNGIKPHPKLDWDLRSLNGGPLKMELTTYEKEALIAFLRTLTDEEFTKDERFSNPF